MKTPVATTERLHWLRSLPVWMLVIAGAMTSVVIQLRSRTALRDLDGIIGRQAEEIENLESENRRLSMLTAANEDSSINTVEALERLRREAASLRDQAGRVEQLRADNRRLEVLVQEKAWSELSPDLRATFQHQESFALQNRQAEYWHPALANFAARAESLTSLDQLAHYLPPEALADSNFSIDQYELVYRGPLASVSSDVRWRIVALREKQPREWPGYGWERTYIYLGGGAVHRHQKENDFTAWERENLTAPRE